MKKSIAAVRFLALVILILGAMSAIFTPPATAELPKEVQFDLLKTHMVGAVKAENHAKVLEVIGKLRVLDMKLPASIHYYEAKSLAALGKDKAALKAAEAYIIQAGRKGKHYTKVLELMVAVEEQAAATAKKKREEAALKKAEDEARIAREEAEKREAEARRIAEAEKKRKNQKKCESLRREAIPLKKIMEAHGMVTVDFPNWRVRVDKYDAASDKYRKLERRAGSLQCDNKFWE